MDFEEMINRAKSGIEKPTGLDAEFVEKRKEKQGVVEQESAPENSVKEQETAPLKKANFDPFEQNKPKNTDEKKQEEATVDKSAPESVESHNVRNSQQDVEAVQQEQPSTLTSSSTNVDEISLDVVTKVMKVVQKVLNHPNQESLWRSVSSQPPENMNVYELVYFMVNGADVDTSIIEAVLHAKKLAQIDRAFFLVEMDEEKLSNIAKTVKDYAPNANIETGNPIQMARSLTTAIEDLDSQTILSLEEFMSAN